MAAGLRTYNTSGQLILDTSTSAGKILGIVNTGTSDGSVSNGGLSNGTPFWMVQSLNVNYSAVQPTVSVSGSTLSWTFNGSRFAGSCTIIYGVY